MAKIFKGNPQFSALKCANFARFRAKLSSVAVSGLWSVGSTFGRHPFICKLSFFKSASLASVISVPISVVVAIWGWGLASVWPFISSMFEAFSAFLGRSQASKGMFLSSFVEFVFVGVVLGVGSSSEKSGIGDIGLDSLEFTNEWFKVGIFNFCGTTVRLCKFDHCIL